MRYEIWTAPGCATRPTLIDETDDLTQALTRARKSDRAEVCDTVTGTSWLLPPQGSKSGNGRFGRGVSLAEARRLGWPL